MSEQTTTGTSREQSSSRTFDPRPYLRTITSDGRHSEYLDVKWRLAWLRTEHPEARITTEHVHLDDESAVFRAMVQIPGGGCATGYGSETRDDWEDFIETAETKAIGRALAALGYGTQFALDFDSDIDPTGQRLADAPAETRRSRRQAQSGSGDGRQAGSGRRRFEAAPGDRAEWSEFWRWARSLGYQNRQQLEELFEHSLDGMTPREVREEIENYRNRDESEESYGRDDE